MTRALVINSQTHLMYRWVVASDAEAAQKIAEEKFPGKVKRLSQAGSSPSHISSLLQTLA